MWQIERSKEDPETGSMDRVLKHSHNVLLTSPSTTRSDGLSEWECGETEEGQRPMKMGSGLCAQERGFSCLGPNGPNEAEREDGGMSMVGM